MQGTLFIVQAWTLASLPVDTQTKLGDTSGPLFDDPTTYKSLAGALQYLTFTRPDITYTVQQVCMHMHSPGLAHWNALKRILRYIQGTADFGLHLHASSSLSIRAYTDADWAGCPDTRRSTSGYCVYLGDNLVSWSSKRQSTISRSSAEAEYRGVANVVAEICWLLNLLLELRWPLFKASLIDIPIEKISLVKHLLNLESGDGPRCIFGSGGVCKLVETKDGLVAWLVMIGSDMTIGLELQPAFQVLDEKW
ncbi:uncharacterized mitochondrial protein AtMg00810-like [Helianthus annuus]|uniref:uncharacterized mitochondrial protein AtMg00810-like n=1 Tax=Helianthus annuus TaxID=4232 RepID=UPI000B8F8915|nr:uncharacterized mitochondrial protein AtMg00810-like [Helianthus annuus]